MNPKGLLVTWTVGGMSLLETATLRFPMSCSPIRSRALASLVSVSLDLRSVPGHLLDSFQGTGELGIGLLAPGLLLLKEALRLLATGLLLLKVYKEQKQNKCEQEEQKEKEQTTKTCLLPSSGQQFPGTPA
jgi:hypothetical protein